MSLREKFRGPTTSIDEQIESYAIDRVPASKRWPIPAISLVLLGNATAMFFFSFGAQQTFLVGWPWLLAPIGYFFLGAIGIGMLTMRMASREGLSQNLLSRGLGFGSRGAAVTSFIYAINYIYYFLFEGTIVSHAISYQFGIEVGSAGGIAIFALVGLATLALVWRGMHAMSFLQAWGFPLFLILLAYALWRLGTAHEPVGPSGWHATGEVGWAAMWSAFSFANGQMIFQGLMATDYGRFAAQRIRYRGTAAIMLGELIPMFAVIFLGVFLGASLLTELGPGGQSQAQDPGFMFVHTMGFAGVLFVLVTQIRINVMNLYSGSVALASGFDVAAHFRPGRPWWMFLVWFVGVIFYAVNVIDSLGTFLAITGVLTNTWVLIILADYFICRRLLGLARREQIEFREHEVRAWNPCGLTSLGVAVLVGALGIVGIYPIYYASFAAMLLGPVLHVAITVATRGRFYRVPTKKDSSQEAADTPVIER
ncbi:purine-cytosine permease family protein [Prauserella flavalba]|uniref:Allantoin permease n=1 Tax=Prauserella flavalba TaxID=1477506 RepID=A0A318LG87_9PSEU|nr:allantoin permease [Prauserella flavalba]PXY18397.1 allantoin permease [Prauserella flavalba]